MCWGVDPRKEPQYRKYQTVSFLSYSKTGYSKHHKQFDQHILQLSRMSLEELKTEHMFDGVKVSQTGNLFQFCDITDPLIAKILATEDIRTTCAPTFQGWYHVGTWAKATVILKDKMNSIIGNEAPNDAIYQRIVEWPELWDDQMVAATYKEEIHDREIHEEKRQEHAVMHQVRWAARNPRYAFEKMEALEGQEREADTTEAIEDVEIPEDMTEDPVTMENVMAEEDNVPESGSEDSEEVEDDADEDGVWEADDDLATSEPNASHGPAPFGGLYNV